MTAQQNTRKNKKMINKTKDSDRKLRDEVLETPEELEQFIDICIDFDRFRGSERFNEELKDREEYDPYGDAKRFYKSYYRDFSWAVQWLLNPNRVPKGLLGVTQSDISREEGRRILKYLSPRKKNYKHFHRIMFIDKKVEYYKLLNNQEVLSNAQQMAENDIFDDFVNEREIKLGCSYNTRFYHINEMDCRKIYLDVRGRLSKRLVPKRMRAKRPTYKTLIEFCFRAGNALITDRSLKEEEYKVLDELEEKVMLHDKLGSGGEGK